MGFFFPEITRSKSVTTGTGGVSVSVLNKLECEVCPRNEPKSKSEERCGHMLPTGSKRPDVYILGEAPSADEVEEDRHFTDESGAFLRSLIPSAFTKRVRFNNVIRGHPPNSRSPDFVEIECCRPSIVRDIEKVKPLVVVGVGETPLNWAVGESVVAQWRGTWLPTRFGSHPCWFFFDPLSIMC